MSQFVRTGPKAVRVRVGCADAEDLLRRRGLARFGARRRVLISYAVAALIVAGLGFGAVLNFANASRGTSAALTRSPTGGLLTHLPIEPGSLAGFNVLLITLDTTRRDRLGCYGCKSAATPTLDALAADGVRFDEARAVGSTTLPTHASILTGLHPLRHQARDNGSFLLPAERTTLAEMLSQRGYATGAAVSAFVLDDSFGVGQGFDSFDADFSDSDAPHFGQYQERRADRTTDAAIAWLKKTAGRPFFLWTHYYDPHQSYRTPPDSDRGQQPYDAEIAFMDQHVGRLLNELSALGARERTLIVAVADHGEGLGQHNEKTHGYLAYDTTLRIPLIMNCPVRLPRGAVLTGRTSQLDIAPTILSLLGVDAPGPLDGAALTAAPAADRDLFVETLHGRVAHGWSPIHGIVSGRHKLLLSPRPELFDLAADPDETVNLIADQPDLAAELTRRIESFYGGDLDAARIAANNRDVSAMDRRKLAALGYVADAAGQPSAGAVDPKDMMTSLNRLESAMFDVELKSDVEQRIALLESVVREIPGLSAAHHFLGSAYAQKGDLERAAAAYARAVRLAPDAPGPLISLGNVKSAQKDPRSAAVAYARIVEKYPQDLKARYQLAVSLLQLKESSQAAEQLLTIVTACPDFEHAAVYLGRALRGAGRGDELPGLLTPILDGRPDMTPVRAALAEHYFSGGDPAKAIALLEEGVRLNPAARETVATLALLLVRCPDDRLRNPARAVVLMEQFCQATGYRDAEAMLTLSHVYAMAGRLDDAMSAAQQARSRAVAAGDVAMQTTIDQVIAERKRDKRS